LWTFWPFALHGNGKGVRENRDIEFRVDTEARNRLKLDAIQAAMQQARDKAEAALTFCGRRILAVELVSVDENEGVGR